MLDVLSLHGKDLVELGLEGCKLGAKLLCKPGLGGVGKKLGRPVGLPYTLHPVKHISWICDPYVFHKGHRMI